MIQFTFGVLAYNHENYIVEHLESIKYQIINYGKYYDISLIIADDCSSDATVEIANKWLESNRCLFKNIKILANNVNIGIVKNMQLLLKSIKTNQFKILAGDDLYYKNDIFTLTDNKGIVLSTVARFNDDSILTFGNNYTYKRMLISKNIRQFIADRLKYYNCIEAPGVFFSHDLINDAVYSRMNGYKWIEDVPMWVEIFNNKNLNIGVDTGIYILYRSSSGISTDSTHEKRKGFISDLNKLNSEVFVKNKFPYNRLLVWEKSLFKKKLAFFYKNNHKIIEYEKNMSKTEKEGNDYLKYIKQKAIFFLSNSKSKKRKG